MSICGFDGGYLPEWAVNNLLDVVRNNNADICEMITLEPSREGRPIRAIKFGKGTGAGRRGVLFVGGLHARELINPDALIYFAFNLADAYRHNTDLVLGGRLYTGLLVRILINTMDIFILPLANPDGRAFVLSPSGDRMWRGNRAPNPTAADCNGDGLPDAAIGVDINRNFDFLWSSGLGTSSNPCSSSQIYKGPAAFSEPETRNIRQLLDLFPQIVGMIDIHSYSQDIIYPWGDDENQTLDPTQNFQNPAFDGHRGVPGDSYKEYMSSADLDWFLMTAGHMQRAVADVRGRTYQVIRSFDVYHSAITGTSTDYSYGRHFVDASKRKVMAFAMESGPLVFRSDGSPDFLHSFQPPYSEATCIMEDIQPAFIELCIDVLCRASDLFDSILLASYAVYPGTVERPALASPSGKRIVTLLQQNWDELLTICRSDPRLWRRSVVGLKRVLSIVQSHQKKRARTFDPVLVRKVDSILAGFAERGTPKLREALQRIQADLPRFEGRTVIEGLKAADETEQQPQRAGS